MRVNKPSYYDEFNCIAGDCDFTCCQEWVIAVDEHTLAKWKNMLAPKDTIPEQKALSSFTNKQMGGCAIKLNKAGKCPLLKENGLCSLVLKYGEESLSKTCHTFPREEHVFADRIEYTLSPGCKSVLELLWQKKAFKILAEERKEEKTYSDAPTCSEYEWKLRDWYLEIASDISVSVTKALKIIFYLLLEFYQKAEQTLDVKLVNEYQNSDIIDKLKDAISQAENVTYDTFCENNELFLDLVDNYCKKKLYSKYLDPITEVARKYETVNDEQMILEKTAQFREVWKQFEEKMRLLVCEEIYSSLLLPESDEYSMVVKIEWLALEYVAIRHWIFLKWDQNQKVTDEDVKEAVAVVFRMTGYSDEDIEEYMENSFESVIWDWGYMDFIL